MAHGGFGVYSFIPDAGFVGTIFVNYISSLAHPVKNGGCPGKVAIFSVMWVITMINRTPVVNIDSWYKSFPVMCGFWQCFTHISEVGFLAIES